MNVNSDVWFTLMEKPLNDKSGYTASFGARAVSGFVEIKILFVDLLK